MPALDRRQSVECTGGQQRLTGVGQPGLERLPVLVDVAEREWGLGAADVEHDQVVDGLAGDERAEVRGDRIDRLACGSGGPGFRPVGQARHHRAETEARSGSDPGRGRVKLCAAGGDPGRVEDTRSPAELLGRFREGGRADLVAADHEVTGFRQRQIAKRGQGRDQPRAVSQPTFHCRQAERDRRSHASKRSDQPKSDPATCHVGLQSVDLAWSWIRAPGLWDWRAV